MSRPLPLEAYRVLLAVGSLDSKLEAREVDSIMRAATEAGAAPEDLDAIARMAWEDQTLAPFDLTHCPREDQYYLYALSMWTSQLDGTQSSEEHAGLDAIAEGLAIEAPTRKAIEDAFRELAANCPDLRALDIAALRARIDSLAGVIP